MFRKFIQRRRDDRSLVRAVEVLKANEQAMIGILAQSVEQRLQEMSPEERANALRILKGEQK